jgi:hypothetical protein
MPYHLLIDLGESEADPSPGFFAVGEGALEAGVLEVF